MLLLPSEPGNESLLDSRIAKIVELIRREPDRNYSQEELGVVLGLSPSRVLHLFSAQVGVPYRRFRMWKRLMLSFELLHGQDNMTFAAHRLWLRRRHPLQPQPSATRSASIRRRCSARSSASSVWSERSRPCGGGTCTTA